MIRFIVHELTAHRISTAGRRHERHAGYSDPYEPDMTALPTDTLGMMRHIAALLGMSAVAGNQVTPALTGEKDTMSWVVPA
jgi:hypothetical protein